MKSRERVAGIHWQWAARRFGVWGVRDYYTLLEQMAREGAEFTLGYVMVILAAGLLATAGLLLDSPAVIIGAMCVAPFLGPSRSVCVGALYRDRKVFVGGLLKQLVGLLVVGTGLAYIITAVLHDSVPGVEITQEILLRAMPNTRDVVLTVIVAIGAGAAASLALTADPRIVAKPWGQIIDAMIGVEIAISLLPPASVIGIGLVFGRPDISRNAFWLLVVNVIGLDFVGSTLMLAIRGVRRRYLALEKRIRQVAQDVVMGQLAFPSMTIVVHVVLLSDAVADVQAILLHQADSTLPTTLAGDIAARIADETGYRSQVIVELVPCQMHSMLRPEDVSLERTIFGS
jgi:uncharacterized hydrophobic protein (TIGR00271 family)